MTVPESFSGNKVETYIRADGKWGWRIVATHGNLPDDIIATDGNQGYESESSLLNGLFSVFFGSYDESFLEAHKRWTQNRKGETPEPYVRQARQTTGGNAPSGESVGTGEDSAPA